MKTHTLHSHRRGFTMVELLVVITIIIVLAGLAIVAVRAGIQGATAGRTSKNMKEIWSSLSAISSEGVNTGHHAPDTFPPYKGSLQEDQTDFIWWDLVAEKMDIADRDGNGFRWSEAPSETILQNPLSKKKIANGEDRRDSLYNDPDLSRGGFAFNAELGGDVSTNAQEENVYSVRLSHAADDASTTIYFAESDDEQETAGWVFKNMKNAPQGNYKDSVHCCFVDGHVELIENKHLKEKSSYDYYTEYKDKNHSNRP